MKNVLPIRNAEDLLADKTLKLPPELVRGILYKGTRGVLAGPSKLGKSHVALDIAVSVATGTPWLTWEAAKGTVLYLNYEIMEAVFAERVRSVKAAKIEQYGDLDFSNFDIWTLRGTKVRPIERIIKDLLCTDGRAYSLIVIDPLYRALGAGRESDPRAVEKLAGLLEELAKRKGTAVLLVHHYPKGKQDGKSLLDRFAGSGTLTRDLDTAIGLAEHEEKNCVKMEFSFRNFPDHPAIVLERQLARFVIREDLDSSAVDAKDDVETEDRGETLLELLGTDGLITSKWQELAAQEHGIPRATFFREKKRLVKAGKVKQEEKSKRWVRTEETRGTGTAGSH
jgi:RecA-family ATPase